LDLHREEGRNAPQSIVHSHPVSCQGQKRGPPVRSQMDGILRVTQGSLEKEGRDGDFLLPLPRSSDPSGFFDNWGMTGSKRIRAFEWHELIALKGARSVLGGLGTRDGLLLPDNSWLLLTRFSPLKRKLLKSSQKFHEGRKGDGQYVLVAEDSHDAWFSLLRDLIPFSYKLYFSVSYYS